MPDPANHRDPVCGERVQPDGTTPCTLFRGRVYYFCSRACQTVFEAFPEASIEAPGEGRPDRDDRVASRGRGEKGR